MIIKWKDLLPQSFAEGVSLMCNLSLFVLGIIEFAIGHYDHAMFSFIEFISLSLVYVLMKEAEKLRNILLLACVAYDGLIKKLHEYEEGERNMKKEEENEQV